jgi:chromosomal replication initiator protein
VFRDPERLAEAEDLVERALAGDTPPPGPTPAFSREAFVMGASNQLAVHAADTVVAEPSVRYNPLVLFGPSGVGKTHLLNAIGNGLVSGDGARRRVACVHAQRFIDELVAAIQGGTIDRWRARYRSVDALLMDDVQFLAGKERTQEEFFLMFNTLIAGGKQIVLSSDRPPNEIPDLEARLRSRFDGGLAVPMQAPDRALRERLIARFLTAAGRAADVSLVSALGEAPVQSVREIIGVVNRLGAVADATGAPLSPQMVRSEPRTQTPFAGMATVPGSVPAHDAAFLNFEKVVWEWPDIGARLIEDFR